MWQLLVQGISRHVQPVTGMSREASPRQPLCHESPTECSSASVLAWAGCRHHRLHKMMPGVYPSVSPSQGAITSP